jgi:hypothetical protein
VVSRAGGCPAISERGVVGSRRPAVSAAAAEMGGDPGIGCGEPCCVLPPHAVSVSGGRRGRETRG